LLSQAFFALLFLFLPEECVPVLANLLVLRTDLLLLFDLALIRIGGVLLQGSRHADGLLAFRYPARVRLICLLLRLLLRPIDHERQFLEFILDLLV